MPFLRFTAYGAAQPKGSTQSFGYLAKDKATGQQRMRTTRTGKHVPVILTATKSDNPKNADWQANVASCALVAMTEARPRLRAFEGPVSVALRFYLPRPKALAPFASHVKRPDLDKLARSCLDALAGVAFGDDSQVDRLLLRKGYAAQGAEPCVEVLVRESRA